MTKIMVTGVSVVDFIFQLEAMPMEAEKFRAKDVSISGGGVAANAAVAINRLGGEVTLVSRLGKDEIGGIIKNQFLNEGIKINHIKECEGYRSSFSSVYVDKFGERQIVNYRDPKLPENASWINKIEEHDVYLADTRWIGGAIETLKIAKYFNRPGVLDAEDKVTEEALNLASHVAFSEFGLKNFTKENNLQTGLQKVRSLTDSWLCVTSGQKGVFLFKEDEVINVPPPKVIVKDTLGAGDVWHGAFALSLSEGSDEFAAVEFANSVASLKCTIFGGRDSFPTREQVSDFIVEQRICS
ncbi:MAG: PfkB family carbohydrate kinase [Pseudomonadota bacterium]|nr:PfkB family carbohydrate kinase [Pseudomonadota bacterium]